MGAVVAVKGSRHIGDGGDDGVLPVVACALVSSLMAVWRWQHARETKICQVIHVER
jgi:hypothetical protein